MTNRSKRHIVDTLSQAAESRFTVLHKRVPLPHGKRQDNGLSEAFVTSLDRSQLRVVRPGDPPVPLSLADAWARLRTEQSRQSLQVERPLLVQVRVSEKEKSRLISLARAEGFESMSAYARARLLGQPGPRSAA